MIKKSTAVICLLIITVLFTGTDSYRIIAAGGHTGPGVNGKAVARQPVRKKTYMASGEVYRIPVILYHSIRYEKGNSVRLPPESFERQMKWLKDNGYNTLGIDEFFDCISGKKAVTARSVLITFDDGYTDNYTTAYKVLKNYGFKAVIFVITHYVGKGGFLTERQLREMSADGIDIQSHTASHRKLDELPYGKQFEEMKESREYLRKLTGKSAAYLSYPHGRYDKSTLRIAKELGYKLAFTVDGKIAVAGCDPYRVSRINIGGFDGLKKFVEKLGL